MKGKEVVYEMWKKSLSCWEEYRSVISACRETMRKAKVIRNSQHGFTKGKSCLTSLIAFYGHITTWANGERAVDVIYLVFSKAFDTVSHDILIQNLRKCGTDEWTVRWVENWLTG